MGSQLSTKLKTRSTPNQQSDTSPQITRHPINQKLDLANLSRAEMVHLQRAIGNHAVNNILNVSNQRLIQRDHTNEPDVFETWMGERLETEFTAYLTAPAEQCRNAAVAVYGFLLEQGFNVEYGVALIWDDPATLDAGDEGAGADNHWWVVVTINGQQMVVDPTQDQFGLETERITPLDNYLELLKLLTDGQPVRYVIGAYEQAGHFDKTYWLSRFQDVEEGTILEPNFLNNP